MFAIDHEEVSDSFVECWRAAGMHLTRKLPAAHQFWLKTDLSAPFLEHLSFRLGNQLFFIRIEDVDDSVPIPGSRALLQRIAKGSNGHSCILAMRRTVSGWQPVHSGWGLVDARTGAPVDPPALVSDEDIEMTAWEVHAFAVQVVAEHIKKLYFLERCQTQTDPEIDPSIWFEGPEALGWVVVRGQRLVAPERPENMAEIARRCAPQSKTGYFAPVQIAHVKQLMQLRPGRFPITPLWRGHGMQVGFPGLLPVVVQ
ncbi:MAG: hypothetical protein ACU0CA_11430 [Paracoccaceae bacterium]